MACTIMTCAGGYYDADGMVADGCECMDDTSSNACNTATPIGVGSLNPGQSANGPAAGVIPLAGMSDWYVIQFPMSGLGMPHVSFTTNTAGAFVFDVFTSCAGAAGGTAGQCSGTETATNLTTWDFNDSLCSGAPPCMQPPRTDTWPSTLYIRVRRSTAGNSCGTYQIHASA
jgi:hypothetical protein